MQASIEITIKMLGAQFQTLATATPRASVALFCVQNYKWDKNNSQGTSEIPLPVLQFSDLG